MELEYFVRKFCPLAYQRILIIAGLLFSGGLIISGVSGQYKPTPDSAEYVGLAQSLVQGQGYSFNGHEGSRYPPLCALVLAGVMKVTGQPGVGWWRLGP